MLQQIALQRCNQVSLGDHTLQLALAQYRQAMQALYRQQRYQLNNVCTRVLALMEN